jgi:hypothetical protein
MNFKNIPRGVYNNGLAFLLQYRIKDSMKEQGKTTRGLARLLAGEMRLGEGYVANIITNLRIQPELELPVKESPYYSVEPSERLRRVAIVLCALNFKEDDRVIKRLRRLYGNDFVYPPLKKESCPIYDPEVFRSFTERFKTWEQLQRPWSGKY